MQSKSKREPLHADDVNALIRAYQLRDDADYLPFRGEAVACFFELLSARAKITQLTRELSLASDANGQLEARVVELEQAQERAYQMLGVNGVPRERAKSVSNGIGVLATRLDRQEQASVPTGETCPHGDNGDCWRCATSPPPTSDRALAVLRDINAWLDSPSQKGGVELDHVPESFMRAWSDTDAWLDAPPVEPSEVPKGHFWRGLDRREVCHNCGQHYDFHKRLIDATLCPSPETDPCHN